MTTTTTTSAAPQPAARVIHVAHSPDSDDAFMFYALATGRIDTQGITYVHELQDIETLNRRALRGELEVRWPCLISRLRLPDRPVCAVVPWRVDGRSLRAAADYPLHRSASNHSQASVSLSPAWADQRRTLHSRLRLPDFVPVSTPFDAIESVVAAGDVDAGLIISRGA